MKGGGGGGGGRCRQYKIWIEVLDEKTKKLDLAMKRLKGPCKHGSGEGEKERE